MKASNNRSDILLARPLAGLFAVLLATGLVGACGSSGADPSGDGDSSGDGDGDNSGDGDGDDAGDGDGDGDNENGDGDGDGDNSGDGDGDGDGDGMGGVVSFPDHEFTYDPDQDAQPEACAAETVIAEPIPLDMYVILDHTGSMSSSGDCRWDLEDGPTEDSKWCRAAHALGKYFTSAQSSGNRAALQFMTAAPKSKSICPAGDSNPHSTPVVDLTDLPDGGSGPLVTALENGQPTSGRGTQIESALNGIADFTVSNETPGRQMIGILITDGDPTFGNQDCDANIDNLAAIPKAHFESTGIRTFIVGMTGATESSLETMAKDAGGPAHDDFCGSQPSPCHFWTVGDGDPAAFVEALEAIQNSVVGCEFEVPSTKDGIVNLDTVDVRFTEAAGSNPMSLGRASSLETCGDDEYYTVKSGETTTILLCPTTCDRVSDDSVVDIEIQCEGK